jgi:restriction system protein
VIEITPKEFELLVYNYLKEQGVSLNDFCVTQNAKVKSYDGNYEIDIKAEFQALNCNFTVLIECKRHRNSIRRDVASLLEGKLQSNGAHKGIIFSTAGFQSGAIEFAKLHGIALIRVYKIEGNGHTRSHAMSGWGLDLVQKFGLNYNSKNRSGEIDLYVVSLPNEATNLSEFLRSS